MKKRLIALMIGAAGISAISAQAAEMTSQGGGFYVEGAIGAGQQKYKPVETFKPVETKPASEKAAEVHADPVSKKTTGGLRVAGGYMFGQNFGVEAGYVNFGKAATFTEQIDAEDKVVPPKADGKPITATAKAKFSGRYVAAVVSMPVNEDLSVFGKVGVSSNQSSIDIGGEGIKGIKTKSKHTSGMLGIGATYNVAQNTDIVVEYDHFGRMPIAGGDVKLKAQMLSVGMRYAF